MTRTWFRSAAFVVALGLAGGIALAADQPEPPGDDAAGPTPPRLSFVDGQASFLRAGAGDWTPAQLNTPLAPGDELYTGSPGNLELQVGSRAFVRAWGSTQFGLEGQEPDYLQFKVTAGYVALDLRSLDPGYSVEVDTPNAAFTIDHPGYYRVEVTPERTAFTARRGGRATLVPANGQAASVAPSEQVVVTGTDAPQVETYAAPSLDDWDRWNYARTEDLLDSASRRYVSPDVYGVDDLDHYGAWRVVPTYGSVWIPEGVPSDWAPYTTGTWVWDPSYGWTWVDNAPWGWAPYHYGRWVFVNGYWGWAPGPVVARPAYAPALVAFFGGGGVGISWCALGWGEPVVPWWGRVGFVGVPRWAGWGGPRIVNNVVISHTTVVHVREITVYRNMSVRNAVVAVPQDRFGHGPMHITRVGRADVGRLQPFHEGLRVAPQLASLAPAVARGIRPPDRDFRRPVVATRTPRDPSTWLQPHGITAPAQNGMPSAHVVPAPKGPNPELASPRPPFGASPTEKPRPSRGPGGSAPTPTQIRPGPPAATGAGGAPHAERSVGPSTPRQAPSEQPRAPMPTAPSKGSRQDVAPPQPRPLPGEPANRLFPAQTERSQGRGPERPSVGAPAARQDRPAERGGSPSARPEPRPSGERGSNVPDGR